MLPLKQLSAKLIQARVFAPFGNYSIEKINLAKHIMYNEEDGKVIIAECYMSYDTGIKFREDKDVYRSKHSVDGIFSIKISDSEELNITLEDAYMTDELIDHSGQYFMRCICKDNKIILQYLDDIVYTKSRFRNLTLER